MNHHPFGAALSALAALILGSTLAVGPVPELGFVAQCAFVGGLIGTAVAYGRDRRTLAGERSDQRFRLGARWTGAGVIVGLIVVLIETVK
jgi:hypothetical protein